jgi:hypothetical protein
MEGSCVMACVEHDCGGMRAANGQYSFDNPVMRDYNAPDFAK